MSLKSRYTLVIDGLSSYTRSRDIKYECERFGKVEAVERDARARCALVEFTSSRDADRAWEKMDGMRVDGAHWKVDWANKKDFSFFGWKWTEGGDDRSPSGSPSRSPSCSPSRSPSRPSSRDGSKDERADLAP